MTIRIVDYDPEWPRQFERESAKIAAALGECALRIEHVGSTSVPGLPAKPIIDIVLAVANSAIEADYVRSLESAGYQLRIREPEWHEHRMFCRADPRSAADAPSATPAATSYQNVNLHVFSAGCPEIERMLAFRDWLRDNADDRECYARSKRALAQQDWNCTQNYAEAKTPVIEEIIGRMRYR